MSFSSDIRALSDKGRTYFQKSAPEGIAGTALGVGLMVPSAIAGAYRGARDSFLGPIKAAYEAFTSRTQSTPSVSQLNALLPGSSGVPSISTIYPNPMRRGTQRRHQ